MKPMNLIEHPEGGRFCEVYRSKSKVRSGRGHGRCALTHIYFSLDAHEVSCFHRVHSDEVWNLYKGEGLCLYLWDGTATAAERVVLSAGTQEFCHVVPAGVWQAARPMGNSVLVGCSVAPGFEFDDFEMMVPESEEARLLCFHDPEACDLVGASPPGPC